MHDREIGDAFWKRPHARIGQFQVYKEGWEAAMRFMAQPRIPAQPEYNYPPGGIPLEPEIPDPDALRFAEDPSRPGFLRRCHNPHGLVAFYTDAPKPPESKPRKLPGLFPSRMRINGPEGYILPQTRLAAVASVQAEFTNRGFAHFEHGFDAKRNRSWVECQSPFTWEESTDNEEYAGRMSCAINGTEFKVPICPKCSHQFGQKYLAANRQVTCSACGHEYEDAS